MNQRPVIYQVIPRLFTNKCTARIKNGSIEENGCGKLNEITPAVLKSISDLGITHVWYTGVIEHAQKTDYSRHGIKPDNPYVVKGNAGSPYAIKDYYDVDPDLACNVPDRMKEFENLIARTHKAGLKAVIDFVPNHLARQYHSDVAPDGTTDFGINDDTDKFFSQANNFYYIPRQQFSPRFYIGEDDNEYVEFPAKATGNDCFTAYPSENDWYETVKLNYGYDPGDNTRHYSPIPDTWTRMLDILLFWASKNVDAFRCDMVHMVPLEFWNWAIVRVKEKYPTIIFIAEIYDVSLYRPYIFNGGFDYLYDKVTLYDTLFGIMKYNTSAAQLTSCWQTVEGISSNMVNFLENHDELRIASPQFAGRPDTIVPALAAICTINKGAVMIYMGQEIGEPATDAEGFSGADGRTTIFDYWGIDTLQRWIGNGKPTLQNLTQHEKWLRKTYQHLLSAVNQSPALQQGGFFDLMYVNMHSTGFNPHKHFVYLRASDKQAAIVFLNFDNHPANADVIIPQHAFDVLSLHEKSIDATDIISCKTLEIDLIADAPIPLSVGPNSALVAVFDI